MYTGNGRIIVKKNCSIGQNFHCTAMGELVIGEDTLITSNVCITDIDHDYSLLNIPILEQEYIHKRTQIGANCFIGFGAVVQAGSILGDNCIVGANSVVRGIFPANSVIAGVPARVVKTFDGDKQLWEKVNREVSK
jgi:acetyltransferase-like isoleucine patch superfamily enzyme